MAKQKAKKKVDAGDVATNREARFRYALSDQVEAGIALLGSEVKSMRDGGVQMKDAYASIENGEIWLRNLHIAPYKHAGNDNHEPERPRKLLLHRREIDRLVGKLNEKGFSLIPTRIYFRNGRAKIEIALGRGKDVGDKRQTIKEREMKREMDRAGADYRRGR
ncbi:MAG: SsrA-binding protein SmpB [Solirubrobacterales bacterium]